MSETMPRGFRGDKYGRQLCGDHYRGGAELPELGPALVEALDDRVVVGILDALGGDAVVEGFEDVLGLFLDEVILEVGDEVIDILGRVVRAGASSVAGVSVAWEVSWPVGVWSSSAWSRAWSSSSSVRVGSRLARYSSVLRTSVRSASC